MKQVAVYVRVSTDKQEADNQLLQLRPFAERSGWQIYNEYVDVASGTKESRPQFDLLFEHAHKKKFDAVLFWSLDRFSRSGTLYTLQKLTELTNLGIDYESYQEQYLRTSGQFRDVVISIMATLAKSERDRISERTKAGLARRKKEAGKLKARGRDKKKRNRRYWRKPT